MLCQNREKYFLVQGTRRAVRLSWRPILVRNRSRSTVVGNGAASHERRPPWFARAWDAVQEPPLSSVAHLRVSIRAARNRRTVIWTPFIWSYNDHSGSRWLQAHVQNLENSPFVLSKGFELVYCTPVICSTLTTSITVLLPVGRCLEPSPVQKLPVTPKILRDGSPRTHNKK